MAVIVRIVVFLGYQNGKYESKSTTDNESPVIDLNETNQLEAVVLARLRDDAKNGSLLESPRLLWLLNVWEKWSGDASEIKNWVTRATSDDEKLIHFLNQFYGTGYSSATGAHRYIVINNMDRFIDPNEVAARLVKIGESGSLEEKTAKVTVDFLRAFARYRPGQTGPFFPDEDDE